MARLRYNNQAGQIAQSLPASGANAVVTFINPPNFATVNAPDYIALNLAPGAGNYEIVWLTAYTAGSRIGTIQRNVEDNGNWPPSQHPAGEYWECGPTTGDLGIGIVTGDVVTNGTTNVTTLIGTANVEDVVRHNSPDQFQPIGSPLNLNGFGLLNCYDQGPYGDGSDGALLLNGTNTYPGISTLGSAPNLVYVLIRDIYASSIDLTGTSAGVLTNGFRIFCTGTFNTGTAATGSPGGAGGTGGGAGGATPAGSLCGSSVGGTSSSTNGNPGTSSTLSMSNGQAGAGGVGFGGTGGAAPTHNAPTNESRQLPDALMPCTWAAGVRSPIFGGDGGGGGGGDTFYSGGGGGGGGGVVVVCARLITGSGILTVNGGAGGTPVAPALQAGGGGGGNGGLLVIVTQSLGGSVITNVAGGAAGIASPGGSVATNGFAGSSGKLVQLTAL